MIQAIHVDRFDLCKEGSILELFPDGFGPHGRDCNHPFPVPYGQPSKPEMCSDFNIALIEHFFELIRRCEFPDKPSRFSCWYGADPAGPDPMHWANRDGFKQYPVWLVESSEGFKADAQLLDIFSIGPDNRRYFNPDMMIQNARYYWQGKTLAQLLVDIGELSHDAAPAPEWEILLKPPIRILECIRP